MWVQLSVKSHDVEMFSHTYAQLWRGDYVVGTQTADLTVDEGLRPLKPFRDKEEGKHRKRKVEYRLVTKNRKKNLRC